MARAGKVYLEVVFRNAEAVEEIVDRMREALQQIDWRHVKQ